MQVIMLQNLILFAREDLEIEAKKKSRWLDEDEEESCGFAIGRRIFEKAEIEVRAVHTHIHVYIC